MAGIDDVAERKEWVDAINSVIAFEGTGPADDTLEKVVAAARRAGAHLPFSANTAKSIGMAADVAHGTCTDLLPQRRK
ncbi:MAG TPA: hypothetical protein VMM15_04100 [Bradyrhizobium sp.]|nr:hypothetical protein [Bradyrhizobium sp.]